MNNTHHTHNTGDTDTMGQHKGVQGGITTMMSRFKPWHFSYNKDRIALTELTIGSGRQALTMARVDWEVNKVSLADYMPDVEGAEDYSLIMRGDKLALVGVNGPDYEPIQNHSVADLADAVIEVCPGANIESAGGLYEPGKVVWVLVRLPDSTVRFGTDGSEMHERYVLISTSHDGSMALTVRPTDVRVECMNTISMAWRGNKAEHVVRHTANAADYLAEAHSALQVSMKNMSAMDLEIQTLLNTELSEMDFSRQFLPKLMGERPEGEGRAVTTWDNKVGQVLDLYFADHNEAITGTAWGAVNAVNEYEEWGKGTRGQERWESQFKRLLTGNYDLTKKALHLVSA